MGPDDLLHTDSPTRPETISNKILTLDKNDYYLNLSEMS